MTIWNNAGNTYRWESYISCITYIPIHLSRQDPTRTWHSYLLIGKDLHSSFGWQTEAAVPWLVSALQLKLSFNCFAITTNSHRVMINRNNWVCRWSSAKVHFSFLLCVDRVGFLVLSKNIKEVWFFYPSFLLRKEQAESMLQANVHVCTYTQTHTQNI